MPQRAETIQKLSLWSAVCLLLLALSSCDPIGYKYNYGELPENPVNLEDFNSPYDDYNSTAPSLGYLIPFCFSTNRQNQGEDFNVIYMPMDVNFDKSSGKLKVTNDYGGWGIRVEDYGVLLQAVKRINTTGNEFGPYLYPVRDHWTGSYEFILMYATDVDGDFDIGFTFNTDSTAFSESQAVPFLNSEFNDLYPTLDTSTNQIYFCSDRENGVYNIFQTELVAADRPLSVALGDTTFHSTSLNQILSSDYDDKCPFIFEHTLVFASNRPGGHGGFDLYYSLFENQQWTAPINFGEKINTADDEYRPILIDEGVDETRHMLVFSSNRTGGQGGFDLYFAGVFKDGE
jgi:hypothetical protein